MFQTLSIRVWRYLRSSRSSPASPHAMVIEAPPIQEAFPQLVEFIGDRVIVGHNVRFDLSFLNAAARRLGYEKLPTRVVDTCGLARRLVRSEVRNLKLATLAAHFRSPVTPTHRAPRRRQGDGSRPPRLARASGNDGRNRARGSVTASDSQGIAQTTEDRSGRRTPSPTGRIPV